MHLPWFSPTAALPPLSAHDVALWWVALDEFDPTTFFATLVHTEQVRAERFYFERDRRRYIVGRGILRTLLGHYVNQSPLTLRLSYNAYHKPLFAEGGIHFNIAHSGGLAVMGFCRFAPLGVDVEHQEVRENWRDIVPMIFSEAEQAWLFAQTPAEQPGLFYTLWTRKEAYLKARGDGFLGSPAHVTLLPDEADVIKPIPPEPDRRWVVEDISAPTGFAAALCRAFQP